MKSGAKRDPNLKLPIETVVTLKKINSRLLNDGFDNIKVLNSIAVDELLEATKPMTKNELLAWVITRIYDLQKRGIVRDNARSIGSTKKKKGKNDAR